MASWKEREGEAGLLAGGEDGDGVAEVLAGRASLAVVEADAAAEDEEDEAAAAAAAGRRVALRGKSGEGSRKGGRRG